MDSSLHSRRVLYIFDLRVETKTMWETEADLVIWTVLETKGYEEVSKQIRK